MDNEIIFHRYFLAVDHKINMGVQIMINYFSIPPHSMKFAIIEIIIIIWCSNILCFNIILDLNFLRLQIIPSSPSVSPVAVIGIAGLQLVDLALVFGHFQGRAATPLRPPPPA